MGMDGLNNAVVPGFATPEQYVREITIANDGIVNQKTLLAYAERSFGMIEELDRWGVKFKKTAAGGARGLRVAWSRSIDGAPVDPEVARLAEAAARVFADELGARVEPVELELGISPDLSRIFWLCGIGAYLEDALPEQEDLLDPDLARRIEHRGTITGIEYARALKRKTEVAERAHAFFARYDLLLTPTLPLAAFPADSEAPTEIGGRPLGPGGFTSDRLPVGLQIVGQRFDDATVLRALAAFEAARP